MRGDTNFKGSDSSDLSVYFLFCANTIPSSEMNITGTLPQAGNHSRSQALFAACVAISPGTNRTGTPQIVVFTGSKRSTALD